MLRGVYRGSSWAGTMQLESQNGYPKAIWLKSCLYGLGMMLIVGTISLVALVVYLSLLTTRTRAVGISPSDLIHPLVVGYLLIWFVLGFTLGLYRSK